MDFRNRRRRRFVGVVAVLVVLVAAVVAVRYVNRPRPTPSAAPRSTSSLLVVTWGPSLCSLERSNPGCRSGHVGGLGPALILHGLWPQPTSEQYCALPAGPRDLSSLNLPKDLQSDLQSKMSDVGIMAPHEWKAHGSCSGVPPAVYFRVSSSLADQAVAVLDPVFRGTDRVSIEAIRAAVDTGFGAGAGKRVTLVCRDTDRGPVAYEVRLSLPPVADLAAAATLSLGAVITQGPTLSGGCRRGSVPR
ncbi:ribonuclease T2 family protein [Mycolicibacterium anyangense]|uniref:ribonuclease T2 family protein n=1 Tax=Mycolicibacterium anyangense TaxID=1431246 RepID=UPI0013D50653|nr:ribonuclease T(2) [Mycolicibacterium anyangense]